MKKLNINRTVILGVLLLLAIVSKAQQERIGAATTFLQQNNLDSAKANINIAIANPATANDANAWYIRGFVYKAIYNKLEKHHNQSPARLEALNSFKKSLALDDAKELFTENIKSIKYLVSSLYNDAGESLDPLEYKTAIALFEQFKEYYKIVDPSPATIQQKEIEFDLALASVYNKILETDKKGNVKFLTLAKNLYIKVLALDPNNISANYGIGILYYNQAVNLIKDQEYDLDIVNLDGVLDNSVKLFKEARPFMEKAYSLDPKRPETIEGLSGIYFSLHDEEKSSLFRKKLEEIKKPK
jgi:tetratricopeptide (TPR) repeat protein